MVCLGNICRSPLAEGILQYKATENNLSIEVDSAGTIATHEGELPDPRSIDVAKIHKIDITNQRSRPLKQTDFETFDLIYVMDASNYSDVIALTENKEQIAKVKMILNESFPNENRKVPDPYFGGDEGFENVYQMLDEACSIIIENLK